MNAVQYIESTVRDLKIFRDLDGLMRVHNAIDMALVMDLIDRKDADAVIRRLPSKQDVWIEQKGRKAPSSIT